VVVPRRGWDVMDDSPAHPACAADCAGTSRMTVITFAHNRLADQGCTAWGPQGKGGVGTSTVTVNPRPRPPRRCSLAVGSACWMGRHHGHLVPRMLGCNRKHRPGREDDQAAGEAHGIQSHLGWAMFTEATARSSGEDRCCTAPSNQSSPIVFGASSSPACSNLPPGTGGRGGSRSPK